MTSGTDPHLHHHPHDWHSAAYVDNWINQDVTDDERRGPLLRRVAALLSGVADEPLRVLDIGGGYGPLSDEVLQTRPVATVVLHDYSAAMIAKATDRLARFGDRVSYRRSDMAEPGWADDLGGPFDAVISALAIHNLDQPEVIRRVYGDVFSLLEPGGWFFNADLVFPTGTGVADLYRRDPTRAQRWDVHVSPAGLGDHLSWLRDAGFSDVDCVAKDLEQTLLCGLRSP